jgi:NAD-dependent dihydropyrimidine dehydrogenase PreA subunit
LGIGTPCHASQASTPVKEYLRSIPSLDNKRAFVFATSSGAPGKVLYDVTRLLRKKGADVVGGFLTRGEVSHPAPAMFGQFPGHPDADDLDHARGFALAVAEHVSTGRSGALPESRSDALKPGWGFYDWVGLTSPDAAIRLMMAEPKVDPARCDQCKWCVYECPMDNITMQPDPVLGNECIRCYRCLTGCPQDAFNANLLVGNLFLTAVYNLTFTRWFGDVKPDEQIY